MIGSIASNAQRFALNSNIIGRTLDSISHSASSFGVALKDSYSMQHGLLSAAYSADDASVSTARPVLHGRMSDADVFTQGLDQIDSKTFGFVSDPILQQHFLGSVYPEQLTGRVASIVL